MSRMLGYVVLALFFFIVIVPLGLVMRLFGKDSLRLRRQPNTASYWSEVKKQSSLDQMF